MLLDKFQHWIVGLGIDKDEPRDISALDHRFDVFDQFFSRLT